LIQILDYAMREGLILENPAKVTSRRKEHRAKVVIPTKAQFKTLLNILRQSDVRYHDAADLCELLAYSGYRLAEATTMIWGDVNLKLSNFTVMGDATILVRALAFLCRGLSFLAMVFSAMVFEPIGEACGEFLSSGGLAT
jgi:site-specific recombinase XerC